MRKNKLGIMQGRLSRPIDNLIQAFPPESWEKEFTDCKKLGLGCIEWIFEHPNLDRNPLNSDLGISKILDTVAGSGVFINSVVADYFMTDRLFGVDTETIEKNVDVLNHLIRQCKKASIPIIELPFVDSSSLADDKNKDEIINTLYDPIVKAKSENIKISLETDLPPTDFQELIHKFPKGSVFINYDMGNSASLGFDPEEEISLLGEYIINVHIKDRLLGGGTVPLGKGNTNFPLIFSLLNEIKYNGDYIFQGARQDLPGSGEKLNPTGTVISYINFVSKFLEKN